MPTAHLNRSRVRMAPVVELTEYPLLPSDLQHLVLQHLTLQHLTLQHLAFQHLTLPPPPNVLHPHLLIQQESKPLLLLLLKPLDIAVAERLKTILSKHGMNQIPRSGSVLNHLVG
jgi:hypothetical protein